MLMDLTFDDNQPKAPLVIFVHGFKGFKDWGTHHLLAEYFAINGFRFLKFNFSHNGTTPQEPLFFSDMIAFSENTFSMELADLDYVINFATNGSAIPAASQIALLGHSMGGGISIIKAAEDPRINKLITMASISGFRNLWPQNWEQQWRLQGYLNFTNSRTGQQMPIKSSLLDDLDQHPARLDILVNAAKVKQPWLIIHGDEDLSVLQNHAEELKAAQPAAELLVLKGGDHVFGASHPYPYDHLPPILKQLADKAVEFITR
jgi:pimeloyl-ACP methyl ester carboxylesterase